MAMIVLKSDNNYFSILVFPVVFYIEIVFASKSWFLQKWKRRTSKATLTTKKIRKAISVVNLRQNSWLQDAVMSATNIYVTIFLCHLNHIDQQNLLANVAFDGFQA